MLDININNYKKNRNLEYLIISISSENFNKLNLNEIIDLINNQVWIYINLGMKDINKSFINIEKNNSETQINNDFNKPHFNFNFSNTNNIKSLKIIYHLSINEYNIDDYNKDDYYCEYNYFNEILNAELNNNILSSFHKLFEKNNINELITNPINLNSLINDLDKKFSFEKNYSYNLYHNLITDNNDNINKNTLYFIPYDLNEQTDLNEDI